ncbi:MAG TPA: cell division topological specificity factor MinE [Candidatus Saccharimonadia bacterium]|nr:cell division topological specificity factor MinE [Candidatus Saccharimonadia bacterium]
MGLLDKLVKHLSPGGYGQQSKNAAKERLKLALTYDRGGLAQGTIERLRDEIIQVIAKHLAINEDEIEINFDRTTEEDRLIASIPLRMAPRERMKRGQMTSG